ncbi:(Fe-S)-binding protein [Thermodesulfobacteriota bacterium]
MPNTLEKELDKISEKCISCDLCQKECTFLRRYGKPKEIADNFRLSSIADAVLPYECSLCRLCSAVCPVELDPAAMFLEMRRSAVDLGLGPFPGHKGMLAYQRRGVSRRYTWYGLPEGCDTVFFPGCTLPGTRPDVTFNLFQLLEMMIPSIGIVLDCCTKPSYDVGQDSFFRSMFDEMKSFLLENGVRQVLTACPNCLSIFDKYGEGLTIRPVLEVMLRNRMPEKKPLGDTITIHDPCAVRFKPDIHKGVRQLIASHGFHLEEMPHSKEKTLCCGEGAGVHSVSPKLADNWVNIRKMEAHGKTVVTYCAGCVSYLGKTMPALHILDLMFHPKQAIKGKARVSKAPFTYLNRLKLKKKLKKYLSVRVARERTLSAEEMAGKGDGSGFF